MTCGGVGKVAIHKMELREAPGERLRRSWGSWGQGSPGAGEDAFPETSVGVMKEAPWGQWAPAFPKPSGARECGAVRQLWPGRSVALPGSRGRQRGGGV